MPLDQKIIDLLQEGEGEFIEFKESLKNIEKEICAFANANGGKLYIGISDNGVIKKIKLTNTLKSQIQASVRSLEPTPEIQIESFDDVICIHVAESQNKPVKAPSGFYLRAGANSQKLTREEIFQFAIKESKIHFDRQLYIEETGESLLAVRKIEWFRERSRLNLKLSNEQLLANLNVLKKQNGTFYLTQGGVLLFVDEPQQIFPQATVTVVHMESPSKILEQKIIKGTLFEQLESAFLFIKERLRTFISISSLQREETLELPEFVIRELLVNAIVHRDYYESSADILIKIFPNSIEFANPGRLTQEIAIQDIYGKSYRRNPLIADLFYRAGYIERAGTGLLRIKEVLQEFRLPPLRIQCEGPFFIATLFRVKDFDQSRDLNSRQKQIESLPPFFSAHDYSRKFSISDRTARQDLKELVDKKIIKRKKQNKRTLYCK